MNAPDYIEIKNKNANQYAYNYFIDEADDENFDDCLLCFNFPSINYSYTQNKYFDIIREIEKFNLLKSNWDGFSAISLSDVVAEKSKIIVENLDFDLYENQDIEVKVTPYSTFVIDWYKGNNEFSLEIGKDFLGYYCDGDIRKEVDKLDISTEHNISNAVIQLEQDLRKML